MIKYNLNARRQIFVPLLEEAMFIQDSAPWKYSRKMLWPLFSFNRENIFTQVEEHIKRFVSCIPTNKFINLQPLFFQFIFNITMFLLFGKSMNSL